MRMRQSCRGTRLVKKALPRPRICGDGGREQLDCNESVKANFASEIANAHPTAPQLTIKRIPSSESLLQREEYAVVRHVNLHSALGFLRRRAAPRNHSSGAPGALGDDAIIARSLARSAPGVGVLPMAVRFTLRVASTATSNPSSYASRPLVVVASVL